MTEENTQEPVSEEPIIEPEKEEPTIEPEQDFEEKYLRLLAEMENSRKRLQKERHEMNRFAIENVLAEILTPLDTFENALGFTDSLSDEMRNWAMGFEMILGQFKGILSQHNVHPFQSKGETFDPHRHEAVEVEESLDHPDGTILHEFLKGYKSGDRVLRAARVKVAKRPKNQETQSKEPTHVAREKKQ